MLVDYTGFEIRRYTTSFAHLPLTATFNISKRKFHSPLYFIQIRKKLAFSAFKVLKKAVAQNVHSENFHDLLKIFKNCEGFIPH